MFTYTLFETLAARPGISYRQLGQKILRCYAVNNLACSTPMFEGDLDAPVFASRVGDKVQQWPVHVEDGQARLSVGRLQGLTEGARLALMVSPADPDAEALGQMVVDFADIFSAELLPVADLQVANIPRGAYLHKLNASLDFAVNARARAGWS